MDVSKVPANKSNAPNTPTWRHENFLSIGPLSKPDIRKETMLINVVADEEKTNQVHYILQS